jgi:hypothetical protein
MPPTSDAYHRLAKAKEAVGESEKALRHSETAYAFYDQLNDEMGCAILCTIRHLYEDKGELENAIRCLERVAIDESTVFRNSPRIRPGWKTFAPR